MQKKIFITIDLPEDVKNDFRDQEKRWKNLRVFWTGFSHLRLTFEDLGIVDKDGLEKIRRALRDTAEETKAFDIRLDRIVLGPNEKDPKMFWATIFDDNSVKDFRKKLRRNLAEEGFDFEDKGFVPHIVLATANGNQLKGKQTNIRIKGKISVEEMDLFSSQAYPKGVIKFKLVESVQLEK